MLIQLFHSVGSSLWLEGCFWSPSARTTTCGSSIPRRCSLPRPCGKPFWYVVQNLATQGKFKHLGVRTEFWYSRRSDREEAGSCCSWRYQSISLLVTRPMSSVQTGRYSKLVRIYLAICQKWWANSDTYWCLRFCKFFLSSNLRCWLQFWLAWCSPALALPELEFRQLSTYGPTKIITIITTEVPHFCYTKLLLITSRAGSGEPCP